MAFIDMHCDTLTALMDGRSDGDLMNNRLSVDLARLKNNGGAIEFFACFVCLGRFKDHDPDEAWDYVIRTLDYYEENRKKYPNDCHKVEKYEDVDRIPSGSSMSPVGTLLTVEEGGVLNGSMERLHGLFDRGVRLITLTWNYDNCLGHPNHQDSEKNSLGLTPFGFEAVEEMERLGMIVDVSHLSDGGFYDVAKGARKPFVASHSNARALCPHPRNLTDDMIRALAQKGGVAGLNFCPSFIDEKAGSTVEGMVAHLSHMIRVGGEDVAAIGTDFDGIDGELEISHTGEMSKLHQALERAGFPSRVIDKIWYGNVRRVLGEVLPG